METKEISIPKFLHDIHGEKSTLYDMALTYGGGLLATFTVWIIYTQSGLDIATWKLVPLLVIAADIGAGVVANFTKGTNKYYSGDTKKKSRVIFILSHFIHPAIFFFSLNLFSIHTVVLVTFVIASTLLINGNKDYEKQKVIAAFLIGVGLSLLSILNVSNPFLMWFFPLYMIKLFLAFGIRRYTN
jgi:hypothetical protein